MAVAGAALATGLIAERAGLTASAVLPGVGGGRARAGRLGAVRTGDARARGSSSESMTAAESRRLDAGGRPGVARSAGWPIVRRTSIGDRRLFAASQAGLVNNLNDGMAWGLLTAVSSRRGACRSSRSACSPRRTRRCGACCRSGSGALVRPDRSSPADRDRHARPGRGDRRHRARVTASALAGGGGRPGPRHGDGLPDPHRGGRRRRGSVLARVGDRGLPACGADLGFAAGAIVSGLVADAAGMPAAIWLVAVLTARVRE